MCACAGGGGEGREASERDNSGRGEETAQVHSVSMVTCNHGNKHNIDVHTYMIYKHYLHT